MALSGPRRIRPIVEISEDLQLLTNYSDRNHRYTMPDLDEAAIFLDRRVSSWWKVSRILRPTITAQWVKPDRQFRIKAGNVDITIPQPAINQYVGIDWVLDERSDTPYVRLGFSATVEPMDSPVFQSGRLRVETFHDFRTEQDETTMSLVLKPEHGLDLDGIRSHLSEAFDRGVSFMDEVFAARRYPIYGYSHQRDLAAMSRAQAS